MSPQDCKVNVKRLGAHNVLYLPAKVYGVLKQHAVDPHKEAREHQEKENAKKKAMKEASQAMVKHWPDSIEGLQRKNMERREQKKDLTQLENFKKYYSLTKDQDTARHDFIKRVEEELFKEKDCCKKLYTAMLESDILYEREKQREFGGELRENQLEIERQFAETVKKGAEDEAMEKKEEQQKLAMERAKYGKELKQTIEEQRELERLERELELAAERDDINKIQQDIDAIRKTQEVERMQNLCSLKEARRRDLKEKLERQRLLQEDENKRDEAIKMFAEMKHHIDCLMKEKERQRREEELARRDALAKEVYQVKVSNEEAENALIRKYEEEREAVEKAKEEVEKQKRLQLREQMLEDMRLQNQMECAKKLQQQEFRKWEMLNMYKLKQLHEQADNKSKASTWERTLNYRRDLLEQIEQLKNRTEDAEERAYLEMIKQVHEDDDKKFMEYAEEVLTRAKNKNRPTYPINKVILEYKKEYGLMPRGVPRPCKHVLSRQRDSGIKSWTNEKDKSLAEHGYFKCPRCTKYYNALKNNK